MKRVIISILIFIITLISNSQAQILENSAIKFGGVVAFQVSNNAPHLGISVGFSKDIFIWEKFSMSSELSYIQKGYAADLSIPTIGGSQSRSSNKLEYLSLIIVGKMRIGGTSSNSYLIGGSTGNYFLKSSYASYNYEKATLGILGGIGGEIEISAPFKIILELIINGDLTRATKTITRELRNTTIELKSGIKF